MELNKHQELLNEVNRISKEYFEAAKKTGERFNIFQILGMQYNENRTHSAFLYSLLNPKGQHLQGTLFLKLFLEEIKWIDNFDLETASVVVEKHIGFIDSNYESGGRIDLVIEDKLGNAILLENKIYAIDQPNQLKRYYNYGLLHYSLGNKNFKLVYLTLDGNHPSNNTTGDLTDDIIQEKIIILSYKAADDNASIINWLEKCKSAVEPNALKEAIEQYINLLKILTNNTNQFNMTDEVKELCLESSENFNAAVEIAVNVNNLKDELYQKFQNEIKKLSKQIKYLDSYYIKFEIKEDPAYMFYISLVIYNQQEINVSASSEFDKLKEVLYNLDSKFDNNDHHIGWIYSSFIKDFRSLSNEEIFNLIKDDNRKKFIDKIFSEGLDYCNDLEQHIKRHQEINNA